MKKKFNNKKGFTLIELLVVIAILGILVITAAPRFIGHTKNAKVMAMKADIKTLESAANMHYVENEEWPIDLFETHNLSTLNKGNEIYHGEGYKINSTLNNVQLANDLSDYIFSPDYSGVFYVPGEKCKNNITHYTTENKQYAEINDNEDQDEINDEVMDYIPANYKLASDDDFERIDENHLANQTI